MRKFLTALILATFTLVISGCTSIPSYKEVSNSEAHAVLIPERNKSRSILGMHPPTAIPLEINGEAINTMWKGPRANRNISPGAVSVYAEENSYGSRVTSYALLKFNAKAGSSYVLGSRPSVENTVFIIKEDGKEIIRQVSKRVPAMRSQATYIPIIIPVN